MHGVASRNPSLCAVLFIKFAPPMQIETFRRSIRFPPPRKRRTLYPKWAHSPRLVIHQCLIVCEAATAVQVDVCHAVQNLLHTDIDPLRNTSVPPDQLDRLRARERTAKLSRWQALFGILRLRLAVRIAIVRLIQKDAIPYRVRNLVQDLPARCIQRTLGCSREEFFLFAGVSSRQPFAELSISAKPMARTVK